MPEYINPHTYTVHLLGPDGKQVLIKSRQKVVLNEYFDRYIARGFIKKANSVPTQFIQKSDPKVQSKIQLSAKQQQPQRRTHNSQSADKAREARRKKKEIINKAKKISQQSMRKRGRGLQTRIGGNKLVVGKKLAIDATKLLHDNLDKNIFPISNNIGVGIMSYNRKKCLQRLVNSIITNTDLRKTTIFISDDGSTDAATINYLDSLKDNPNIVIIRNKDNIGVAGNSNRLLRCLSRFEYGLILNDDVEVLKPGWDYFYVEAMKKTNIHHFQYREVGVYGAKLGELVNKGAFHIRKVNEKPHGAVLSFTHEMLIKCGYFNESFGKYGMEHVDWSMKPAEFGLQEPGFFDVEGSDSYFKLHSDESSVTDKSIHLNKSRKLFNNRISKYKVNPTSTSIIPEITYIIPFRNIDRENSIVTVVNNIRAQRFPVINIIIVEQDQSTRIKLSRFKPIRHYLVAAGNPLFNKSKAFNFGVSKVTSDKIVLHDADMLVLSDYTTKISNALDKFDSCHLGGTVIYTSQDAMRNINDIGIVDTQTNCERVVGYYEGGSIACTKDAYWKIGGFNEDYWGYGCEDCDFYARLSNGTKWHENRHFDLLHLWHSRVDNWDNHHKENKALESKLCKMSINQRISLQRSQMRRLGYGDYIK